MSPNPYRRIVRDGFKKIPAALQIEEVFGEADHFIDYSGPRPQWNTGVRFDGRYELTMQVNLKVDRWNGKIVSVDGEPEFFLHEVNEIREDSVRYDVSAQRQFGTDQWNQIFAARGDLSPVGIERKKNRPVPGFDDYVRRVSESRTRIRP